MIFINFMPGSMGFFVIKTIHKSWPIVFDYKEEWAYKVSHDSHSYGPDVFLDNHSEIAPQDLNWLIENNGNPGLVLVHNIDLLPRRMLTGHEVYNIVCDIEEQAQASFLSFIKNLEWHMDYITDEFTNIGNGIWAELFRYTAMYKQPTFGKMIKFSQLHHPTALDSILASVQQQYNTPGKAALLLPSRIDIKWYNNQYEKAKSPINNNIKAFQIWRTCFIELKKKHYDELPQPQDALTPGQFGNWQLFTAWCVNKYAD